MLLTEIPINLLQFFLNLLKISLKIIFWIFYSILVIKNFIIKRKYGRERIENNSNLQIARSLEENKDRVYVVNNKKKVYRHIVNPYTLKTLGFGSEDAPTDDDKCFSKNGYKLGKRIEIVDLNKKIDEKIDFIDKLFK